MAKSGPKGKLELTPRGQKSDTAKPSDIVQRLVPLIPPKRLNKGQQATWDREIEPAWWLDQGDATLAYIYTLHVTAYLKKPLDFSVTDTREIRRMMSELHLTTTERARLNIAKEPQSPAVNPAGEFFKE